MKWERKVQINQFCITIIIILAFFHFKWKSGTFRVPGGSCQDAGQHGANLGHPGKSVTGGNQRSSTSNYVYCDVISAKVLLIGKNTITILN